MTLPAPLASVVIPVMNEAECLPALLAELRRATAGQNYRFEFIFVDDGSSDSTPEVLAQERMADERVCYLSLSRNFGHQSALAAGLFYARGTAVITMDGDLQHPPALIPVLLEKFEAGADIVNTHRRTTDDAGLIKRVLSAGFYKAFNWLASIRLEPGSADFRLLSRPVVDVLNEIPEARKFLRGLIPWLGYRQMVVPFDAPARHAGASKYSWAKNIRLAMDGMTAFSTNPLRKMALGGGIIAGFAFLYGFVAILAHLFTEATVPGWTSMLVSILFLGGCQLVALGVLGEYNGRILEQVKGRPVFIVRVAAGFDQFSGTLPLSEPVPARQAA
jgi:dolichol-phosphate mannosyltransferase